MKIYESLTKAEPPIQEHVIELNNVLGGENNIICKLLKLQIFSGLLSFLSFSFSHLQDTNHTKISQRNPFIFGKSDVMGLNYEQLFLIGSKLLTIRNPMQVPTLKSHVTPRSSFYTSITFLLPLPQPSVPLLSSWKNSTQKNPSLLHHNHNSLRNNLVKKLLLFLTSKLPSLHIHFP